MNNITELRMPTVLAATLISFLGSSCAEKEAVDTAEELCLEIRLSEDTRSPIYEKYLPDGASIGVTLVEEGKDTYNGVRYHNIRFTASGTGTDQIWTSETPVILSETYGELYAYYPYTEDYNNHEIEMTNDDTDNMYGLAYNKVNRDNKTAKIFLHHSKFITRVRVERGTYKGEGKISCITLNTLGTWRYVRRNVINYAGYADGTPEYSDIKRFNGPFSLDDRPTLETMWIPCLINIGNPLDISVEIDGIGYSARTSDYVWGRGEIYDFTFTLNEKTITQNLYLVNMIPHISSSNDRIWEAFKDQNISSSRPYIDSNQSLYNDYCLRLTASAEKSATAVRTIEGVAFDPSHIYYMRVEGYAESDIGTISLWWPEDNRISDKVHLNPGEWTMCSARIGGNSIAAGNYPLRINLDNRYSEGYVWLDGMMLIDLTLHFGAGKEPGKEVCDAIPYFALGEDVEISYVLGKIE